MPNTIPVTVGVSPLEMFSWSRFFRRFAPLFIVSAILPVILNAAFSFTQAERSNEIRLWFEPETVVVKPHQQATITLMAAFEDDTRFMSSLTVPLSASVGLATAPQKVVYDKPFRGTISISKISISATAPGQYLINIPAQTVATSYGSEISAVTSPATIIVRDN